MSKELITFVSFHLLSRLSLILEILRAGRLLQEYFSKQTVLQPQSGQCQTFMREGKAIVQQVQAAVTNRHLSTAPFIRED